MKTSHIEKIPDSCLPSDEILAQLGFEKADNPTRPPEQHSPLPWTALVNSIVTIGIPGRGAIATLRETDCEGGLHLTPEIAEANAAYIVKAANEYPKLVADRDLWQTKAENWERLATTKLQVVKDLTAQRDELLAALKSVTSRIESCDLNPEIEDLITKCEAQP